MGTSRTKKKTARLRRARRAKSTQLSALCAEHCAAQNLAKKSRFLKFCEKMPQKSRFFRQCLRRARRAQKKKKTQHGYAAHAAQKAHNCQHSARRTARRRIYVSNDGFFRYRPLCSILRRTT